MSKQGTPTFGMLFYRAEMETDNDRKLVGG